MKSLVGKSKNSFNKSGHFIKCLHSQFKVGTGNSNVLMEPFIVYLESGSVDIFGQPVATSSGHNKRFIRVNLQSVRQNVALTTFIQWDIALRSFDD